MQSVQRIHNTSCVENVSSAERWMSALAGGALLTYGLKAQPNPARLLAGLGAFGLFQRAITGHCMLYSALGINRSETRSPMASVRHGHGIKIEKSVTVAGPRESLYRWWRNLQNLKLIFPNITSVQVEGNRSHWTIRGPAKMTFEWDAEIYMEEENELISWRSLENSEVRHAGSVIFRDIPEGRGVEVKVVINYEPPGGVLGSQIAKFLGDDPEAQLDVALNRYKQLAETGEAAINISPTSAQLRQAMF